MGSSGHIDRARSAGKRIGRVMRLGVAGAGGFLSACAYYPDEGGSAGYYNAGYYYAGHHHYPRDYYYSGHHHRYGYSHNHQGHGKHDHRYAGADDRDRDGDRDQRQRRHGDRDHHSKKDKDQHAGRERNDGHRTETPASNVAPPQADGASSNEWRTINTPTGVVRIPAVIPEGRSAAAVQPRSRGEVSGRTPKARRQAVKSQRRAAKAQRQAAKAQYKAQYKAAKANNKGSSSNRPKASWSKSHRTRSYSGSRGKSYNGGYRGGNSR